MTALCKGLPEEWWWTGDDGNRLAQAICRRCTGCPDNDPAPHGVIRGGIAYSDNGRPLLACPTCGRPHLNYRGGTLTPCSRCAVPDVAIPSTQGDRIGQIKALVAARLDDAQIGAELGMRPDAVRRLRLKAGVFRRARPLPVPA